LQRAAQYEKYLALFNYIFVIDGNILTICFACLKRNRKHDSCNGWLWLYWKQLYILDWLAAGYEPVINLDKLTYAGNSENLASLDTDDRMSLLKVISVILLW